MDVKERKKHRACAACKSRKVKCNGAQPACQQCTHLNLRCEYPALHNATPRPRTKRGGIITQYKKQAPSTSTLAQPGPISIQARHAITNKQFGPIQYDDQYFFNRLNEYEQNIYPVFPIITPQELRAAISNRHADRYDAALVYSLFAVTVGHTKVKGTASDDASKLVNMALDARGVVKPGTPIDIRSIIIVVGMSSALVAGDHIQTAWLYLREAVTMSSIMNLQDVTKAEQIVSVNERARRLRMYWMLYIHERFMAIHFYRPVLMSPIDTLPELDPSIPAGVHYGFLQIIKLFRLVDGNFIKAYLGDDTEITQKWIQQKHNEIVDSESGLESLSEMQQADLIVTQQWLLMLVWQMAMSRYWLSTGLSEGCMSLLLPVEIAHRLRSLVAKTSERSIEVHGSAILRKLFELSIAIADVIILIPAKSLKESSDRIEDYMWIANFLLRQPSFTAVQKTVLTEKLDKVQSVLPHTPASRPESPEELKQDDPWFSLSKSIASGTSPKELLEMDRPLLPNLNLSEMSNTLLNELFSGYPQ